MSIEQIKNWWPMLMAIVGLSMAAGVAQFQIAHSAEDIEALEDVDRAIQKKAEDRNARVQGSLNAMQMELGFQSIELEDLRQDFEKYAERAEQSDERIESLLRELADK